jgi:hypothetical protein
MCTIPPSSPALLILAISRSTLRALEGKANHVAPLVHRYNVESPTDRIVNILLCPSCFQFWQIRWLIFKAELSWIHWLTQNPTVKLKTLVYSGSETYLKVGMTGYMYVTTYYPLPQILGNIEHAKNFKPWEFAADYRSIVENSGQASHGTSLGLP